MSADVHPDDLERLLRRTMTGAQVLDDLDGFFGRYVAFPSEHARTAVVLWAAHAHVLDAFESTPRLALLSPEKGSGKTRCLEVLGHVVPHPMHAVNVSAAALFRIVASEKRPTILLDEADTYLGALVAKQHEDLRGLVNAGHRRGAEVWRCEVAGKTITTKAFPAFAAVALAGLGDLPDTILDRSIVIAMKRRAPDEPLEPFRERLVRPEAERIIDCLARWAEARRDTIAQLWPPMPPGITDRASDVWEPLVAIADDSGGTWPERARAAAVALNAARAERDPSLGVRLLADCRSVFAAATTDRLTSDQLVEHLIRLDDAPWGDLRGKPLDARGLARRLRKYDVLPGVLRFGDTTRRGYTTEAFYDGWTRYLPPVTDVSVVTHPQGMRETVTEDDSLFRSMTDKQQYVTNNNKERASLSSSGGTQQAKQPKHDDVDLDELERRYPDEF